MTVVNALHAASIIPASEDPATAKTLAALMSSASTNRAWSHQADAASGSVILLEVLAQALTNFSEKGFLELAANGRLLRA